MRDATAGQGPRLVGHAAHPHLLQEVMRTSQALTSVFSRHVGMPSARLALLRVLAIAHPQRLGVMALARELGVNAAAVTRLVQALEEEQFVVRAGDPRDRRRSGLALTAKGRRAFGELHDRGHELERQLRANVTDEDIATATRVLGELRKSIEAMR